MADVFLSYAREDKERAEHIAQLLEQSGIDVFWDNEIPPGVSWADFIETKLKNAKAMIVLWSNASVSSQWVREEARLGRDAGKLIPAALDNASPPFGFGEVQAADLSAWDGTTEHSSWMRFLKAIQTRTGVDTNTTQPASPAPSQAFTSQGGSAFQASAAASQSPSPQQPGWQSQSQSKSTANATSSAAGSGSTGIGFFDAIKICLSKYADGKGRAGKAEFWWFVLFQFLIGMGVGMIDLALFGTVSFITVIATLAFASPSISVAARRLHDINFTGWLGFLVIIPYLGWIATIVIGVINGTAGQNQYGPDPRNPEDLSEVFG